MTPDQRPSNCYPNPGEIKMERPPGYTEAKKTARLQGQIFPNDHLSRTNLGKTIKVKLKKTRGIDIGEPGNLGHLAADDFDDC